MCAAVKVDPGQEICDAEPPPVIALDGFQRESSASSVGIFGPVASGGKISHAYRVHVDISVHRASHRVVDLESIEQVFGLVRASARKVQLIRIVIHYLG